MSKKDNAMRPGQERKALRKVTDALKWRASAARNLAFAAKDYTAIPHLTPTTDAFEAAAEEFVDAHLTVGIEWKEFHEKRITPSERMRIAYHEAGHAVAARKLGLPVDYINIVPKGATLGHVMLTGPEVPDPELDIIFSMAGPVAEKRLTGERLKIAHNDRQHVLMALEMAAHSRQHYIRLTEKLVADNWEAIVDVAEELIRVGKISGDRLDLILYRVGKDKSHAQQTLPRRLCRDG